MNIENEIKQKEPFPNEFIKADINIMFTSSWIDKHKAKILKPYNLSWQQFNILRNLRDMNSKPASIKLLMETMIDKMSNVSRLVEKLKNKGYVKRQASAIDRRQVDILLTNEGLELVNKTSLLLETKLSERFQTITKEEAIELNRILDKLHGTNLD